MALTQIQKDRVEYVINSNNMRQVVRDTCDALIASASNEDRTKLASLALIQFERSQLSPEMENLTAIEAWQEFLSSPEWAIGYGIAFTPTAPEASAVQTELLSQILAVINAEKAELDSLVL